tara:strand:- start:14627 stop:15052 length:426 start_codon:yes stop_codon:yes gene_type:complete
MQNTLNTIDPNQYTPFTVGFETLFDKLFDLDTNTNTYPPYNIVKITDNKYVIEMALAGFSKKDVEIRVTDGELVVNSANSNKKSDNNDIIHKGISYRSFQRKFTLSEDIYVKDAEMNNGMLKIILERKIPEHKKPKLISIK